MTDIQDAPGAQEVLDTPGIPELPTFASIEAERQHRKDRLASVFRVFSKFGFEEGLAGHVTARDPELTDHFWVNPLGVPFGHMKQSDLLLVDHDGRVVEGNQPLNLAAFAIHSRIHRPDVQRSTLWNRS